MKFSNGETTLEAGGFQSFEAYDVLIANLDTSLERREPAEDAAEVLPEFPDGLTTAEVAQIMAEDKYPPDLDGRRGRADRGHGGGPGAPRPVRTRRALGADAPPRPSWPRRRRPSPTGSASTG